MSGAHSQRPGPEGTREGTCVFTGERAARGYRLNKLAASLTDPANREAFLRDEDAYARRFGLTGAERRLLAARDWQGMVEHGGSVYLLLKIAATVGSNLLEMGAQMRGEPLEAFLRTRPGASAPVRRG